MKSQRHIFMVLYYSKRHNEHVESGNTHYLNPYNVSTTHKKKHAQSYACHVKAKKKNLKKAKKAKKNHKKVVKKAIVMKRRGVNVKVKKWRLTLPELHPALSIGWA